VQILLRCERKNAPGSVTGFSRGGRSDGVDHDVELRLHQSLIVFTGVQASPKLLCSQQTKVEPFRKLPAFLQRKQLLRRPQRDRGRAWPGTFEADFSKMQFS